MLGRNYTRAVVGCCEHVDDFVSLDDWSDEVDAVTGHLRTLAPDAIVHALPHKTVVKAAHQARIPLRIGTGRQRTLGSRVRILSERGGEVLVGDGVAAAMESAATSAGASVRLAELKPDMKAIDATMADAELDAMYIAAGPGSSGGTLETDAAAWEHLFDLHCKAPYFAVAKALPLLRRSEQPRVVIVAPLPACSPESFAAPAVPCALISQIRGLYVLGMAEEALELQRANGLGEAASAAGAAGNDSAAAEALREAEAMLEVRRQAAAAEVKQLAAERRRCAAEAERCARRVIERSAKVGDLAAEALPYLAR